MQGIDAHAPEELIAEMNRRRHWKVLAALGGLVLALGVLFGAALVMYSEDPAADVQPTTLPPAALKPAPVAER